MWKACLQKSLGIFELSTDRACSPVPSSYSYWDATCNALLCSSARAVGNSSPKVIEGRTSYTYLLLLLVVLLYKMERFDEDEGRSKRGARAVGSPFYHLVQPLSTRN